MTPPTDGPGGKQSTMPDDGPSFWVALAGFCVPLLGLAFYFENRKEAPQYGRSGLRGATWGSGALLALVVFAVGYRMVVPRENAKSPSCQSHLKQMGLGLNQYLQDHDRLPDLSTPESVSAALLPYTKSPQVHSCPYSEQLLIGNRALSKLKWEKIDNASETMVFYDSAPVHYDGRNVCFADGHVKWMKEEDFQKAMPNGGMPEVWDRSRT